MLGRRSPCGERGLKYLPSSSHGVFSCRSPCGERGLKFTPSGESGTLTESLPVRGAWIEMFWGRKPL